MFLWQLWPQNLVRKLTSHKNSENLTCIDLMLTDVPRSFQSTCVIETGLSDFHSIIFTVMRKECRKFQSRIISYRSQRHFCNKKFRKNLLYTYRNVFFSLRNFLTQLWQDPDCETTTLKKLKWLEQVFVRKIKKLLCVNFKETKKWYYNDLHKMCIADNKLFWKTVKPSLSDKIMKWDKVSLTQNDKIIKTDRKNSGIFKWFSSKILESLDIKWYKIGSGFFVNNTTDNGLPWFAWGGQIDPPPSLWFFEKCIF